MSYQLPPMPDPTKVKTKLITQDFGVYPSDTEDLTSKLQSALDKMKVGDFVVFPPGPYRHSKALKAQRWDVTLWGEQGATIVGTHYDECAFAILADNVELYNFTFHAVTGTERLSGSYDKRISIIGNLGGARVTGSVIRRCRVIPGPGMPNSSSSAGILAHHAERFLIAECTVQCSGSDGIHVTQGSRYGKVVWNRLDKNGDDYVACVSILKSGDIWAQRADALVHHILVEGNYGTDQYHGRGFTVVGGEHITVRDNYAVRPTHGAAFAALREAGFFGVDNVLFEDNYAEDVQTTNPPYAWGPDKPQSKTGQGAAEVNTTATTAEQGDPALLEHLKVKNVSFRNNRFNRVNDDGLRLNPRGLKQLKQIGRIDFIGNVLQAIGDTPINNDAEADLYAHDNTLDGSMCDEWNECAPPACATGCGL